MDCLTSDVNQVENYRTARVYFEKVVNEKND